MRYPIVHFENGATQSLMVGSVEDDEDAKEIALRGIESITGKPREQLVRVTKVEWVDIDFKKARK